jgi:hypothetical protein
MKVIEFRYLNNTDSYDKKINEYVSLAAWSRPYEYSFVLDVIERENSKNIKVHNTSWGFADVHDILRKQLNSLYECVHSDIRSSNHPKTKVWNIKDPPSNEELNFYDVVVNVSTVEEVEGNHVEILKNLLSMVKPNGILIVTMDVPGAQIYEISNWLEQNVKETGQKLNGSNSSLPNMNYSNLNVVALVVRK